MWRPASWTAILGTLYAIAGAFGQTSPVLLVLRALGRALRQEAAWLRSRLLP